MTQTKKSELMDGTLTMKNGETWPVKLEVTTSESREGGGVERFSTFALVSCLVPDGEYVLTCSSFFKSHGMPVRVEFGKLRGR